MPVIEKAAALIELEAIEEIFDVKYDEDDKSKILQAVMDGRFTTDAQAETVCYQLIKSIEQKNGDTKENLIFRTPSVSDIEYINKGFTMKVDKSGNTEMDMGALSERTKRAVLRLSGIPLGLFERISRKDMRVFTGLFNFFD
ncbi:MAG: hypothetical protein PQJ46_09430 [Spirochaetales bacterium]|nr:hypothetical protein [Spirochaetales bacterium]